MVSPVANSLWRAEAGGAGWSAVFFVAAADEADAVRRASEVEAAIGAAIAGADRGDLAGEADRLEATAERLANPGPHATWSERSACHAEAQDYRYMVRRLRGVGHGSR